MKENTNKPRWGRLAQAMDRSGQSRSALYRLKADGSVITSKVRGVTYWDLDSIDALIEAGIQTPAGVSR